MENKEQNALLQIAQMSDCGSYENTMLRMKQIATEALRQSSQPINSGWVSVEEQAVLLTKLESVRNNTYDLGFSENKRRSWLKSFLRNLHKEGICLMPLPQPPKQ
jgi:hypothetical protein